MTDDETSAEPRVVWSHEPKKGTCYRVIQLGPGHQKNEVSDSRNGMKQRTWIGRSIDSWAFAALLADYAVLQEAVPPPNIPDLPSALSAFVAENPGRSTSELLNRTPPNHKTWTKLHNALLADPQISWEEAGTAERKCGWHAVYGKPEAAEEASVTDDALVGLVRQHRGKTTDELWRIIGTSCAWSAIELHARLLANPRVHGGPTEPKRWYPTFKNCTFENDESGVEVAATDPEFVGPTLEELVRDNPGKTTQELRDLLASPELCELVELAEGLASTPGVRAVRRHASPLVEYPTPSVVAWWPPLEPEPTPDDALVDLVRRHPDSSAERLWGHVASFRKFLERLWAHPGIHATHVDGGATTYHLAEDAP